MRRYCLKSGDKYVSKNWNNSFSFVPDRERAITYDEENKYKLENIRKTLPHLMRRQNIILTYFETDYESPILNEKKNYENEFDIEGRAEDNNDTFTHTSESALPVINDSIDLHVLCEKIKDLSIELKKITELKDTVSERLSYVDLEITDILHYIEFYKFSASEAWKLCKMLQDALDKRRKIKYEYEIYGMLGTQTCKHIANGTTEQLFNRREVHTYKPRVLTELFKDKEKRKRSFD